MRMKPTLDTSFRHCATAMSPAPSDARSGSRTRLRGTPDAAFSGFGRRGIGRGYCGSGLRRSRSKQVSPQAAAYAGSLSPRHLTRADRFTEFTSGRAGHGRFCRYGAGSTALTGPIAISTGLSCRYANSGIADLLRSAKRTILSSAGIGRWSTTPALIYRSRQPSLVSRVPANLTSSDTSA